MPASCHDIRAALAECLQNSDCIMVQRNSPSDCLRPPLVDTLPTRCQQLKKGYGECKRGMIDMRKRFRGNKPVSLESSQEPGSDSGTGNMLYAGGLAGGSGVKPTGNNPASNQEKESS